MVEKLYLMSVGTQLKQIDEYCFKCGAIIVGQVNYEGGQFACCRRPYCPHEEKSVDMGPALMSDGKIEHVIVRKLK